MKKQDMDTVLHFIENEGSNGSYGSNRQKTDNMTKPRPLFLDDYSKPVHYLVNDAGIWFQYKDLQHLIDPHIADRFAAFRNSRPGAEVRSLPVDGQHRAEVFVSETGILALVPRGPLHARRRANVLELILKARAETEDSHFYAG